MKKLITTMLGVTALVLTSITNASVILEDNFNTENGGVGALNYNSFINWDVSFGTVDLIGNGYFDFLPGNGLYVDLDGSTGNAGVLGSLQTLSAGDYRISFDLAGNQRNNAAEFTSASVAILAGSGTAAQQTFSLAKNTGFTTFSLDFSIDLLPPTSDIFISFGASGGDNIGMLLDNVKLETVPEPTLLALFGLGLAGLGLAGRRRKS